MITTKQVFLICKLGVHRDKDENGAIVQYNNVLLQNTEDGSVRWGFKDCREFTDYKMAEDVIKELSRGQYKIEKYFINEEVKLGFKVPENVGDEQP